MSIEGFLSAMVTFFKDFRQTDFAGWWFPFVGALSLWLVVVLLSQRIRGRHPHSHEFQLRRVMVIAVCVTSGILIAVFSYLWANTSYYVYRPYQFIHWLVVLTLLLTGLIFTLRYAFLHHRQHIRHLVHPPLTTGERNRFSKNTRAFYQRHKLWLLVPGIGFLMLLFVLNTPSYLLAILLDNSSSMSAHIENGKSSLTRTIQSLDPNTDLILSWFSEVNPKEELSHITGASSWQTLEGRHAFFNDREQAIQYLQNIPETGTTPLYETLFSQFLFAQSQSDNNEYQKKVLVIVSDGEDYFFQDKPSVLNGLLCSDPEFDAFWEEVGIMNLGGSLTRPFLDKVINSCQYYVEEDATVLSSYEAGIDEMTATLKRDWYFPVWMIVTYFIWLVICAIVPPKPY